MSEHRSTSKKYLAIVNPRGGVRRGLDVLEKVEHIFAAAGAELEIRQTEYAGHATELARAVDAGEYEAVCVVGGDGTVHEVVNGLIRDDCGPTIPLGMIPAGTGNTLHHHLGCGDPLEAAQAILAGQSRPLDVAKVTLSDRTVYCINIVGWGAIADINLTAEKLRLLGRYRYNVAAVWKILRPIARPVNLRLDDEQLDGKYLFVIACNTKSTGSKMLMAPRAEIDDGLLDVVAFQSPSRLRMLKFFFKLRYGAHLNLPGVEYRQVSSIELNSTGHEPLNLDGEIIGTAPFQLQVLPGALQVLTPHPAT